MDADAPAMTEPLTGDATPLIASPEARIRAFAGAEHAKVVAAISLWSGSFDDATDAVAEALARAWERLDRGDAVDNLAAWVTRTAMNEVRSLHRHRGVLRRKRHLVPVGTDVDDHAVTSADRIDVRRALGGLTERQREVIALRYGLDASIAEMAAQLGVAPGTVKATLHQARSALAESLTHLTPGAPHDR